MTEDMGARLKEARIKAGYKYASEAARALGVGETTYRAHENGANNFNAEEAKKYARKFDTSAQKLIFGNELNVSTGARVSSGASNDNTNLIPHLAVMAGMGGGGVAEHVNTSENGITFQKDAIRDHWKVPDFVLDRMGVSRKNLFVLTGNGDSMLDTIHDKDAVFIDSSVRSPSQDGIYAIGDPFYGVIVKRLTYIGVIDDEPTFRISSDNKDHPSKEEKLSQIDVYGRFCGLLSFA